MKQLAIAIAFGFFGCNGQTKPVEPIRTVNDLPEQTTSLSPIEIKGLDSVNIDFQFRGNCYAYSSAKNAKASNGEAHSGNLPHRVNSSFPRPGFYLVINQNEFSKVDSANLGCKLYLVNTTDSIVELNASDSRLDIIAEALNDNNEWTSISHLPSSWCGNSSHTVILDKEEYWKFDIPVFKGEFKTKLRYVLAIDNVKISSNEIVTYLNKCQFDKENKQGHRSFSIMDPYEE